MKNLALFGLCTLVGIMLLVNPDGALATAKINETLTTNTIQQNDKRVFRTHLTNYELPGDHADFVINYSPSLKQIDYQLTVDAVSTNTIVILRLGRPVIHLEFEDGLDITFEDSKVRRSVSEYDEYTEEYYTSDSWTITLLPANIRGSISNPEDYLIRQLISKEIVSLRFEDKRLSKNNTVIIPVTKKGKSLFSSYFKLCGKIDNNDKTPAQVADVPEAVKPVEVPKATEKPVVVSEPKKVEAPKSAAQDLQKEEPASKEAKSTGYRESTPKELSFDDIVTRPFGVLPKDRKKSTMEQILSDLANYDWKIVTDNKLHSIELQKAGGYDMTILGEIPHSARSHFFGVKGNETELYSFSYAFIFKNHKQASQFAERLLSFLRAEGVELPDTSKYSNEVSAKYGNTLIEVKTPEKGQSYMSLNIGYWGGYWSNGEWRSGWIE